MLPENVIVRKTSESALQTNAVLRNTYFLLSLTLLFSTAMAAVAMMTNAAPMNPIILIAGMFGLLFLTQALSNSAWGLLATFAFTGFMGYSLGPVLNMYLEMFTNGSQLIMTSLGGTAFIFLALSGYVLTTRKDFSYMGGFLFVAAMVAFLGGIASLFFNMPLLNLIVSGAFALIASGMILFETSQIIQGGETNYIRATVSLYVAIFNLFISLLRLLGALAGNRE